jgi:hypothetical protein
MNSAVSFIRDSLMLQAKLFHVLNPIAGGSTFVVLPFSILSRRATLETSSLELSTQANVANSPTNVATRRIILQFSFNQVLSTRKKAGKF